MATKSEMRFSYFLSWLRDGLQHCYNLALSQKSNSLTAVLHAAPLPRISYSKVLRS